MLFLHTIGQTWQNTIGWKTLALIVNKSVASSLLGVARLYLIIIARNAAPVSRAHKKLKFRAESAVLKLDSLNTMIQRTANENLSVYVGSHVKDLISQKSCGMSRPQAREKALGTRLAQSAKISIWVHLWSSPSPELTRPKEVETAVHDCNSWLLVWTLTFRCPVKFSWRSISLASLFSSLSTYSRFAYFYCL